MTADDLSAPLGQRSERRKRPRLPVTGTQAVAGLLGLTLAGFAGFALFHHDPLGGEPIARVNLQPAAPDAKSVANVPPSAATKSTADAHRSDSVEPPAGHKTITIIDGSSGARQSVVVPGNADEKSAGDGLAPAAGIDSRLLEKSRYGMIPVVAADGLKPFTAYAAGTDADRAKVAHVPTIAIVVSGLGVGATKTADAIKTLPGAVTLAFTPYGIDPAKLVERPRAHHPEGLVQVSMEPFDYPDNDPGPQTLLTTLDSEQNIDRLLWHLGRVQGYVGLASFMGARFVVSDAAMQPIIHEAAKRGLGYFDDGSAPRSVASSLAQAQSMPFGKADANIDAVPTAGEIDRALASLENIAKSRGNAIGVASALPVSIERISTWAKTLASRGVTLVPLTTAMLKSKSG